MHVFASLAPQTLGVPPPPHVWSPVQVPHDGMTPPHPSPVGPHFTVAGQPTGVQPPVHAPLMHASPAGQLPHCSVPPHPSGHSPHVTDAGHAVRGVHATHFPATH